MIHRDLQNRQIAEKVFHDEKFAKHKRKNFYDMGFTGQILAIMLNKIGNIKDKKVVEFGCGEGWLTKILANMGAEVWAFDISEEAVRKTKDLLKRENLRYRVHVDQMAAESLIYDLDMFDLTVGVAILHHLDLGQSLKEIRRVLKKGGKGYFMEPLGHNPVLNIFRKITPHLRSKDEKPLRFEKFSLVKDHFEKFEHEEHYLTSMFALFWYFIGTERLMLETRDILFKFDNLILSSFPKIRKYCWYSILEMEK